MKTILIVDDDDQFAETMEKALVSAGYHVTRANDGLEAQVLYDPEKTDLVVTDLIMPVIEGVELILLLRKQNPKVKVIAMSGAGGHRAGTYLEGAERMGAMRTLIKPFTTEELLTAVQEVLADH